MANPREVRKSARDTPPKWLKASRVAAELDVSVPTVKRLIAEGKVEALRLTPNGEWRISRASLDGYLASLRSRCFAPDARTAFDCGHPDDGFQAQCPVCGALRTDAAAGS